MVDHERLASLGLPPLQVLYVGCPPGFPSVLLTHPCSFTAPACRGKTRKAILRPHRHRTGSQFRAWRPGRVHWKFDTRRNFQSPDLYWEPAGGRIAGQQWGGKIWKATAQGYGPASHVASKPAMIDSSAGGLSCRRAVRPGTCLQSALRGFQAANRRRSRDGTASRGPVGSDILCAPGKVSGTPKGAGPASRRAEMLMFTAGMPLVAGRSPC